MFLFPDEGNRHYIEILRYEMDCRSRINNIIGKEMSESYIGLDPSYGAFEKQLITGDGTNSTFDLDYPVGQPVSCWCLLTVLFKNQNMHSQFNLRLVVQRLTLQTYHQMVQEFLLCIWEDSYYLPHCKLITCTLMNLMVTIVQQRIYIDTDTC